MTTMRTTKLATMAGAAVITAAGLAHALTPGDTYIDAKGAYLVSFSDQVNRFEETRYTLSYSGSANFVCAKATGTLLPLPQFQQRISFSGSESTVISGDIVGRISGDLQSALPAPPRELQDQCPAGYDAMLQHVAYDNVRLARAGASTNLPGRSRTIILLGT